MIRLLPVLVLAATQLVAIPPPPPSDLRIEAEFTRSWIGGGDTGTLRITVTNGGFATAHGSRINLAFAGGFPQPATTESWSCSAPHSAAECVIQKPLAEGDSITLEIPFIAEAATQGFELHMQAHVSPGPGTSDPNPINNYAAATIAVRPATQQTDAAVRATFADGPVSLESYANTVIVANNGSRRISNVMVYITTRARVEVTTTSPDWTCTPGTSTTACTYAGTIGGGEEVELPLVFRAPYPGTFEGGIGVVYAGGIETTEDDNYLPFALVFGLAEDFEPVLVPFLANGLPGAFGSVWSSDLVAHSTELVPILGPPCDDRAFVDNYTSHLWPNEICVERFSTGALMYVARKQRQAITFNSRLYEGFDLVAQLPIVRGSDFRDVVILPAVPRAGRHRYSLRVYSLHPEAEWVTLKQFGVGFMSQPYPATRTLTRHSGERVGPGLLRYAAYAEFGHDDVTRLLGPQPERVTLVVEGAAPIWAMLVIVHNDSQRPVFITPQ